MVWEFDHNILVLQNTANLAALFLSEIRTVH